MVIERIDHQGTEDFLHSPTPEMKAFRDHYLKIQKEHQINDIYIRDL